MNKTLKRIGCIVGVILLTPILFLIGVFCWYSYELENPPPDSEYIAILEEFSEKKLSSCNVKVLYKAYSYEMYSCAVFQVDSFCFDEVIQGILSIKIIEKVPKNFSLKIDDFLEKKDVKNVDSLYLINKTYVGFIYPSIILYYNNLDGTIFKNGEWNY